MKERCIRKTANIVLIVFFIDFIFLRCSPAKEGFIPDKRDIRTGWQIPTQTYSDQPYIVKTDDGAWLCCVTTGAGREGQVGQHIVTMRSKDLGKTWTNPVNVEPPDGPEASYAVMLKVPSGRIFIFYNHNTDNIRQIKADDPPFRGGWCKRVDSQGYFVFKYSDDNGQSWSEKRYSIPVREFQIDRKNVYGGKIRFFWNVGKPFIHKRAGFVPLTKVGGFGEGFFTSNEGVLLKSDNILFENDPAKISWQTLPDGDVGLRTPPGGGPIAAEQSYTVLSDGSFYCVYRTIDGYPVYTYSRDGGHTWEPPQYMRYADGRLIKHPRAANFVWKCENGKYLYWYHNHGGRFIRENPNRRTMAFNDRNPAWLCGGVEADSPRGKVIKWSQPEIVLYDDDPMIRMSYPDLVEQDGKYFITETQKNIARVHEIDPTLLHGLWAQFDNSVQGATRGLILNLPAPDGRIPSQVNAPRFANFVTRDYSRADHGSKDLRSGFTIDLWIQFESLKPGQVILDNRKGGRGFCLRTTDRRTVEIVLNDGQTENCWDCDPGMLDTKKRRHIAVIVDGGPKIIYFLVNGKFCDGGDYRQFGWGRFSPNLKGVNGDSTLLIGPSLDGRILSLRLYDRYLRTSEIIANFHNGNDSIHYDNDQAVKRR